MRLKENSDNWAASSVIRKEAMAPEEVRSKSKKNRNRWCKGKVGREHDYDFVEMWGFAYMWQGDWHSFDFPKDRDYCYANYACLNCGKKLWGIYLPMETIENGEV